jgi:2-deoxy-D-gluconate 3-dehydrogenase
VILEKFSLQGKTALITGSPRGLGAGIAMALAKAGANVAIHGSRTVPEVTRQMLNKIGANQLAGLAM